MRSPITETDGRAEYTETFDTLEQYQKAVHDFWALCGRGANAAGHTMPNGTIKGTFSYWVENVKFLQKVLDTNCKRLYK